MSRPSGYVSVQYADQRKVCGVDPASTNDILIVDDRPEKILALEVALADLSPPVVIHRAQSGREALRQLLLREFAVILLDVNMPGMDGFETASLIRQRKSCEQTPIIFVTAVADELLAHHGYRLGAVDYILAPIVPEVLRAKVRVFVELAAKTRQVEQQAKRLEQRARQLGELASQLAQAEERERRRLARLLHDHLQQLLVAARMRVGMLTRGTLSGREAAPDTLAEIDRLLVQAVDASRSLTVQLSPPVLYDAGLVAALEWLANRMKAEQHLDVQIIADEGDEPQSEDVRILLFHGAREMLFNVVKHANVTTAQVMLERVGTPDAPELRLTVSDSGAGFAVPSQPEATGDAPRDSANDVTTQRRPSRDRFGLFSIGERIRLMDGRLEIDSRPGEGSRVSLIVPWDSGDTTRSHTDTSPLLRGTPDRNSHAEQRRARLSDLVDDASIPRRVLPEGERPIRVLLVDDHEILRKGTASLLAQFEDIEVVGEAEDGHSAVELTDRLSPDVVVMDVTLPGLSGLDATRLITAAHPGVVVIGLSMHDEQSMAQRMTEAGATMYLTKGGPSGALLAAIRTVAVAARDEASDVA